MLHWTVHLKQGPKIFHAAVAVGHKVYSFGVYGNINQHMGQMEVDVFNTVSLRWTRLPTGQGERPLEVPSVRYSHTAVLIEDAIYIWGGITVTTMYCNTLYAFDVDTHRWLKPESSGAVPEARCNHSACVLGKVMYVFGGFQETGYNNDIYMLDTTSMVWSLINPGGTPAPASVCHSATIIGTKMFVFGGYNYNFHNCYNSIRVFDTETNCWLSTPFAQLLPEGRWGHSAFAYIGELYIFAGFTFSVNGTFNDLWKFNPETFSRKRVQPKGKGPCFPVCRMCCCMVGDRIILFGGYTPNDLYILDLSPSLTTLCKLAVIHHGLEQSGLPQDIRWELAAMTTNSN